MKIKITQNQIERIKKIIKKDVENMPTDGRELYPFLFGMLSGSIEIIFKTNNIDC